MKTEKRKAKIGERVVLIKKEREGQIGTVERVDDYGVAIKLDNRPLMHMTDHENYEVITGDDMMYKAQCDFCKTTLGDAYCSNEYGGAYCSAVCAHISEQRQDAELIGNKATSRTIQNPDKMEVLLDDLVEAIEVNSKKMKQEHENGHDYAYLRYLQGKDQAYRDILEMIDGEVEDDE